jgi:hypothetical protein
MENWTAVFALIIIGAAVNLLVAVVAFRSLGRFFGVPNSINTFGRALKSMVTILPAAGAAGAPFFVIPFAGPVLGTVVSACVAPWLMSERYDMTQGESAKIILPTVLVVYIVSGVILYYGIPML